MVELYFKQLKSKWFLLFVVSILAMQVFYYQDYSSSGVSLESWIIYGNFVTTFVNNAFFIFCISRIKVFQSIKDMCIIRNSNDQWVNTLIKIGMIEDIIYIIACHMFTIFLHFSSIENIFGLFVYITITAILFMIYEMIYIIVILKKSNFYLLVIPFILNLGIHYLLVLR